MSEAWRGVAIAPHPHSCSRSSHAPFKETLQLVLPAPKLLQLLGVGRQHLQSGKQGGAKGRVSKSGAYVGPLHLQEFLSKP